MIILDFETKSRADLTVVGTYEYVIDPSTDILCCAFINTKTGDKVIWHPEMGEPSDMLLHWLCDAEFIGAHYAEFDQGIYECIAVQDYGFPEIPREKWYCTSAHCRVNALPAGLDDAAWALGLKQRKYASGSNLIKLLSIPREDGTFNPDPVLHAEMRQYCMQDAIVTAAIVDNTRMMSVREHEDWLKTCEINERGIKCDLILARHALQYASAEQAEIAGKLTKVTAGIITKHTQSARIKAFILEQMGELHPIMQAMTVYKKGKATFSLDKHIRATILSMIDGAEIMVPEQIRQIIELLDQGSMSSVAKFKRMLERANPEDHRVRGAFVFAGAPQTIRFASRGLQLHNMKRDCWSAGETEDIKFDMACGGHLDRGEGVMVTLSKLLRPALIPDQGKAFVVGDWSAIEGMCLPWLAESPGGDLKLERFKRGEDIYVSTALDMGMDEQDQSRQIGKVCELALGFSGGVGAFQSMARNFGLHVSDPSAQRLVERWRGVNTWAMDFAREMNRAASNAVKYPGEYFTAGRVKYIFNPDFIDGTLFCVLPGDHVLQYPQCRSEMQVTPWGDERMGLSSLKAGFKPKADAKEWPRVKLWPGLLVENATQGFAAVLLRNALRDLPDVVAHVHDEIVMEVPADLADEAAGVLRSVMIDVPEWAEGLPLKAEPQIMFRYGK